MKKRSETNAYLFPKMNEKLTTEEINRNTREQLDREEEYHQAYLRRLNKRNRKVRTRGKKE